MDKQFFTEIVAFALKYFIKMTCSIYWQSNIILSFLSTRKSMQ